MKHINTPSTKYSYLMLKISGMHNTHHALKVMKLSLKLPNFKTMIHISRNSGHISTKL
jgi:hypothetical protein